MQIVIDMPEEVLNSIKTFKGKFICENGYDLIQGIKNGTSIPRGHGRIKDIDKIEWYGCTTDFDCPFRHLDCKDCERAECDKTQVDEIPTIIEADEVES